MTYEQRVEIYTIQSCLVVGTALADTDILLSWSDRLVRYHEKNGKVNAHEYDAILIQVTDYFKGGIKENEAKALYSICSHKDI